MRPAAMALALLAMISPASADVDDPFEAPDAGADGCTAPPDRAKAIETEKGILHLIELTAKLDLASRRTLTIQNGVPAGMRRGVAVLKCNEPSLSGRELADAQAIEARALKWADDRERALAAEAKGRAEIVVPLCEAQWGADNAEKVIAQERANPSGVVDLRVLHDAGDSLRYYREIVARLKPPYARFRGHSFVRWQDEGACVEDASAQ